MPKVKKNDQNHKNKKILFTKTALNKIKSLLNKEYDKTLNLRISVQSGGCAGLKYQLFFDNKLEKNDIVNKFSNISIVVDQLSMSYLKGAKIDFEDTISKQGFIIDNPNASDSCSCGNSFN